MSPDPAGQHADDEVPPLRVLYVDDNHDVADSAVILLRIVGFDAQACYDGPSALREAETFAPSLCLIDLNMPGMDGDELAAALRADPNIMPPVLVAVSAMGDESSRRRTTAAGFDLHLVKPVDPQKMIAVVDTLYRAWTVARAAWKPGVPAASSG